MIIPTESAAADDASVNLTPLIDVVFLLLIFFMVTATFQNDERDFAITVPEAENGDPINDLPHTIFVAVRKGGSFVVGGRTLDKEQLRVVLTRAKRKNKDKQRVVVRAHKESQTQHPVTVFDICRKLEIRSSIATAKKAGG